MDGNGVAQVQTGFDRSLVKFRDRFAIGMVGGLFLILIVVMAFQSFMSSAQTSRETEYKAYLAANPEVACKNKYQMDLFNAGKCKYGKCLGVSMANLIAPAGYCDKP